MRSDEERTWPNGAPKGRSLLARHWGWGWLLASDKAGFITGITIQIDGGLTARFPIYADELAARAGACPRNQPRRSSR
jgi:hypothetical protein